MKDPIEFLKRKIDNFQNTPSSRSGAEKAIPREGPATNGHKTNGHKSLTGWLAEKFLQRKFPPKEPLVDGLLHRRDQVTLAGRRRHGKTTLLLNLCVALAVLNRFLGFEIPKPRRSLMLFLEDDPGELQAKLSKILDRRDDGGRICIVMRDDFYRANVRIDIRESKFKTALRKMVKEHGPDLIVIDNLAHVIGADYNDSKLIHELMVEVFKLAEEYNAAIIIAAHPRKEDIKKPIKLAKSPETFFETVMGSSHFVNSTGSLWGLQREDELTVFPGGRQRAEGQQGLTLLEKGEDDWFAVLPDTVRGAALVNHTPTRKKAWALLPLYPVIFGYTEGQQRVEPAMHSSSTYAAWMRDLRRHGLVVEAEGKLRKCAVGGEKGGGK